MPKPVKRLSPIQFVGVLVILVIVGVYQFIERGSSPQPAQLEPTTVTASSRSKTTARPTLTGAGQPTSPQPTNTPAQGFASIPTLPAAFTGQLSEFDYFILALSWSPDYCASNSANDPQQCSLGKKLGFVLHGLWPQYNQGYPSDCSTAPLPEDVKAQFPGLYPNDNLFTHEWGKHGTCTGLSPEQYLTLTKLINGSLLIPGAYRSPNSPFRARADQLKEAFTQTNPAFGAASFEVHCSGSGRFLRELYVCFARDGQPTACSVEVQKEAAKSCQQADFLVRNAR